MGKKYSLITILLLLVLAAGNGLAGNCIYTDSLWNNQKATGKQALLDNPPFAKIDEECFLAYLDRLIIALPKKGACSGLLTSLKNYCESKNSFTPSLFSAFLKKTGPALKGCSSADIVKVWERFNGPLRYRFAQLEERGQYPEADTLYGILHAMSRLDVYDLMKWAEIKGICGDYTGIATLFCDLSENDNNLVAVARSQFAAQLEAAVSSEQRRKSLDAYKKCYLNQKGADTLSLSYWLSEIYGRFNLFTEENRTILDLDRNPQSKGRRLLDVAQRRFIQNLFLPALPAALEAWKYVSADHEKQTCAIILYRSYAQAGKTDSSIIWLKKIRLATDQNKADAIILYQKSGMFEKADSIIQTLNSPLIRDTLTIRQFLYKGAPENAFSFAAARNVSSYWKSAPADNYLWKIRTASFCGMLPEVSLYYDSLKTAGYSPSWPYAAEVLECRMALSRLESSPEAFTYWGRLGCLVYIGKPGEAVAGLGKNQWPPEIAEYCAASLLEALIQKGLYDTAKHLLDILPQSESSMKINYFRALVDLNLGHIDTAKRLFEKILLSGPQDMYADKARIYLLKLKDFHTR